MKTGQARMKLAEPRVTGVAVSLLTESILNLTPMAFPLRDSCRQFTLRANNSLCPFGFVI